MQVRLIVFLLFATVGFAKQTASDIPVTTYLADFDATGTPYYVHSDGGGAYVNGADALSVLLANGYNGLVDGDLRLGLANSTTRTVGITFDPANAVQPGDPGYQAPANPPFWGTQYEAAVVEDKCTQDYHDMLTMKAGNSFPCVLIIRFPGPSTGGVYRLIMGTSWNSETNDVLVSCNSADSGGCNDWFIDPIPVVNPDGSTSPGRARARLVFDFRNQTQVTDDGDFYLNFHIHVTRP